ncbi:MAG: RsmB/NOP family class I SAM-dependent RNA methyltransferase, partial [Chlamydiia bacterium]|nr:RsmB/NOP family class I SAM-dependent RNA methyltransferase [Chlamydiia bacterium]
MRPFRHHHLIRVLEKIEQSALPYDRLLSTYFRENPALGSKDRKWIAETLYALTRWKLLVEAFTPMANDWEKTFAFIDTLDISKLTQDEQWQKLPPHVRVSFPETLYQLLAAAYGDERAQELCLISNTQAPLTLRANTIKCTPEELLSQLTSFAPKSIPEYPQAIQLEKRTNLFTIPAFKEGLFEVQDEGSQKLAELIEAKPGEHVLDYCSGSGGKALAIAPKMQGKGQLYLHDIRQHTLEEARQRFKRAGVENYKIAGDSKGLNPLKGKMDWVVVDAPCTGTGTLRRNPDMKWRFTEEGLREMVSMQREIVEKEVSYLKKTGILVYMNCSMIPAENE